MSAPTLQPIANWLEKLGLGQHAQRFVENKIDVSVLRHLIERQFGVNLTEFLRSPSSPMGGKCGYRIGYRHQ